MAPGKHNLSLLCCSTLQHGKLSSLPWVFFQDRNKPRDKDVYACACVSAQKLFQSHQFVHSFRGKALSSLPVTSVILPLSLYIADSCCIFPSFLSDTNTVNKYMTHCSYPLILSTSFSTVYNRFTIHAPFSFLLGFTLASVFLPSPLTPSWLTFLFFRLFIDSVKVWWSCIHSNGESGVSVH